MKFDADTMLEQALSKHTVRLDLLIAETAIWAHPDVHIRLFQQGNAAKYPHVRRARTGKGESREITASGLRLDDNTYANRTIKWAIGTHRQQIKGYEACHIWPATCYDERYHTVIANLVLLPRALAGLTDHLKHIQQSLQYRAYELYGWHPEETAVPVRPKNYATCWRDPEPDIIRNATARKRKPIDQPKKLSIEDRLKKWFLSPNSNVHKIISLAIKNEGMLKDDFVRLIHQKSFSKNAKGAVSSLMTDKSNAYGAVLRVDSEKRLFIGRETKVILKTLGWR